MDYFVFFFLFKEKERERVGEVRSEMAGESADRTRENYVTKDR